MEKWKSDEKSFVRYCFYLCDRLWMKVQKNLPFVPYKTENTVLAKYNRMHPTEAESKIWEEMLKHRPMGYKFTRQKPLEAYIADFYCAGLMLVIEIDGDSHKGRGYYDEIRESKLAEYGIEVIRYTNQEVMGDSEKVKKHLEAYIERRMKLFV